MSEKILTVAVPAYNAAPYLEKCLSSFVCVRMGEIEVIVVNDGSADATPDIAQGFIDRYPDVYKLINKENGGHGSGINRASEAATGKYFRVVDADDWVLSENLPAYLDALKKSEADVVLTHFHTVDMTSGVRIPFRNEGLAYGIDHDRTALLACMDKAAAWFCIHAITYRTAFYQGLRLKLTEKIFYEDTEYAVLPFADCKSVRLVDLFLYEYMVGNSSQSVSIASYCKRHEHLRTVFERILAQYGARHAQSEATEAFLKKRLCALLGTYEKVMLLYLPQRAKGREAIKNMLRSIRAVEPEIVRMNCKRRLALLVCHYLRISPRGLEKTYSHIKQKRKQS